MTRLAVAGLYLVLLTTPLAAGAQPAVKVARIGFLTSAGPVVTPAGEAFVSGLRELGWVEGQNIVIERRFAEGRFERLPDLAAELVRRRVQLIVVAGPGPIRAAKDATRTIPIVMLAGSSDPVAEGLVATLARPGGNITGLTCAVSSERFGKQLELLKSVAVRTSRVAVLWDLLLDLYHRIWAAPLKEAGRTLDLEVHEPVTVREASDIEGLATVFRQQRADALLTATGGTLFAHRGRVAAMALQAGLPNAFATQPQTQADAARVVGLGFSRHCTDICVLVAPFSLPSGAQIVAIELEAFDNDPNGLVNANRFRCPVGSSTGCLGTGVGVNTLLSETPGEVRLRGDVTVPITVDKAAETWVLRVGIHGTSGLTRLGGLRVFYRLQVSPAPALASFSDVPTSHPFFQFVEALAASGITVGCGGGNFCPDAPLTRGQMAVFLSTALGLHFAP
jgi:putative ABC transport system substrate-binding protein